MNQASYIVSPQWLQEQLQQQPERFLLIDMSKAGIYQQAHLHNAINVDYNRLQAGGDIAGLAPSQQEIAQLLSELGVRDDIHVIAYDEEGGTRAARFLWILALAGHQQFSYLDGGIHAWLALDYPYSSESYVPTPSHYSIEALQTEHVISMEELLISHQQPNTVVWDARTPEEYYGIRVNAKRGGHIPNAKNYSWDNAIDRHNDNLLRPLAEIQEELNQLGITADKEVVVHCQTHHRSSFAWLLAKHLGYKTVRGFAGSWAQWGNAEHTPITLPEQQPELEAEPLDEFDLALSF